jgi:hypothetical protein
MYDLIRNYDGADSADFEKELEVTIIEENVDGFMVDLEMKSEGIIQKKLEGNKVPTELKAGAKVKEKLLNTYGRPVFLTEKLLRKQKKMGRGAGNF